MSAAAIIKQRRSAGSERELWDHWLLGAVLTLIVLGLIMVYSASISAAERATGDGSYYLVRHGIHVLLGLVMMLLVMHSRIHYWAAWGPYLLLAGFALLLLLLVPGMGVSVNGSTRWLRFLGINLQPSEFMKLIMVSYVAGYLVRKQQALQRFVPGFVVLSSVVASVGMLLLQQPDLGTLVVISFTVMAMLFLAGVRFWHFFIVLATGFGGMAVLTWLSPYRFERVTGFLDPWADPFNTGFQLVQALIAFGRGEWFGVGLGASVQKLFYLPAAHTDFLLSVVAEEMGLLVVWVVMALFAVIVLRALTIARHAEYAGEIFGARLAQGIALLLGAQALINMGVNLGVLPTKGLTLPLMSYGGSSMVSSCIAVGMLLMIEREVRMRSWGKA